MVKVLSTYETAFEYYEQSAHLGHAKAQCNLGAMHYEGEGVVRDDAKVRGWWEKAVAQHNQNAIKKSQSTRKKLTNK
jgi:TPR repeat protein